EEIVTKDKKNETAAVSKDIKSENKTKDISVKEEIVETNNKSDITTLKDKNENLVDNTENKDNIKAASSDKTSLFNSIINELPKEVRKNIVDDIKEIKSSSKQLISEAKSQQTKIDLPKDTKQTIAKQSVEKINVNITQKDNISANMFLGAQKNANELGKIQKITQSKKVLEEVKTTTGVKKSADILELNATDIEITTEGGEKKIEVVKKDTQIKSINSFLDKLILEQNKHIKNPINQPTTIFPTASKIIEKAQTSQTSKIKETIELTVPNNVAQVFTTKVIGARQQVGSFMSEVARNMYLNYKPPVTAFRLNLNPASLGSISIMLKSNKADKSMSVSMNMSSTATLESFIDNKASLQSALQRNFSETSSNISLSFGMQSDSSNHAFEQAKQEQNNNQSQDIHMEQTLIDDEIIQDTQDYM
ncbi:MAG: flagellar hook-length control protein FliK, partial [Arcobacteraceae bacterium]|nr:flagellar hook-length control protein FliK [Arcobacteraceae bacterium]